MGKFEKIVIASDIDGTFLAKGSKQVPRNLDAIKYFCDNGGHFTFATGRLPIFMRKSLPNTRELINMPAVTGNGSCLYDFSAERALEEYFIRMDDITELVEFVKSFSADAGFRTAFDKGFTIPDTYNKYAEKQYQLLPDFMEKHRLPVEEWGNFDIYKVNIMDEPETLLSLYAALKERFAHRLSVTRAGPAAIEVMAHGRSKAEMLDRVVRSTFGEDALLCTVGDHDNDLEMHSVADLPVCPANANEAVKQACKLCLCDHNDGVIGDLVEYLDKNI